MKKFEWSSHLDKDLSDLTDEKSPKYDKELTKQIKAKYGDVDSFKSKLKREKKKQDKIKKQEAFQKALLEPNIKNNLVIWVDKYKNGNIYEGYFSKQKCFEIKRGVISFSLKICHEEINAERKSRSSMDLFNLQEKANKILQANPMFQKKFK